MKTQIKETSYTFTFLDIKNNVLDKTTSAHYSYKEAMIYRENIMAESTLNGLVKIKIKKA
jgi:hypothetical protein